MIIRVSNSASNINKNSNSNSSNDSTYTGFSSKNENTNNSHNKTQKISNFSWWNPKVETGISAHTCTHTLGLGGSA